MVYVCIYRCTVHKCAIANRKCFWDNSWNRIWTTFNGVKRCVLHRNSFLAEEYYEFSTPYLYLAAYYQLQPSSVVQSSIPIEFRREKWHAYMIIAAKITIAQLIGLFTNTSTSLRYNSHSFPFFCFQFHTQTHPVNPTVDFSAALVIFTAYLVRFFCSKFLKFQKFKCCLWNTHLFFFFLGSKMSH